MPSSKGTNNKEVTSERQEGPVLEGLRPQRHGASPSGSAKMPSPKTALLWVECYVCHKKVPLCRIKAHQRISHTPPVAGTASHSPSSKEEAVNPGLATGATKQLNILDLKN